MGGKTVGTIAETANHDRYFEYASSWLSDGFSLSPYFLPLKSGLMQESTKLFEGLFGVFDDSLPDGWGRLLTDRFFRKLGKVPESLSPLDRLAYVGYNGMGSLEYEPMVEDSDLGRIAFDLGEIAMQAERVVNGSPEDVLPALRIAGGSSGGSRPKVFVTYNPTTGKMSSEPWDASRDKEIWEHWLVKFRAKEDPIDAGLIEMAYAKMAVDSGIDLPSTRIFESSAGRFFGIRRFDWLQRGLRLHTHTFGGLIHSDFRSPNRDYKEYLAIVLDITKDFRQVEQAYRRAAFNVYAHNRDDHVKNFAFLFHPGIGWSLSPAYDLTWSHGVRGEHNMMVMGNGTPGTKELLLLAHETGISDHSAQQIIKDVRSAVAVWPKTATAFEVSKESASRIYKDLLSIN